MLRTSRTSKRQTTIVSTRVRSVSGSRDEGTKNADKQADSRNSHKNDHHTSHNITLNSGKKSKSERRSNEKESAAPAVRKSETAKGKTSVRTTRRVRQVRTEKVNCLLVYSV